MARANVAGILDRMDRAVQKVKTRLRRVVKVLESASIDYAIIGGNAVAAWVATVEESAARNTQDVDILINRNDLSQIKQVLQQEGFIHRKVAGIDLFLDGSDAGPRDAVHVVFAGEKVHPQYELPAPNLSETETFDEGWQILSLSSLIRMKLTSFRRKDQVHILDLMGVDLVTEKDLDGLPPALASRLQELLDNPDA